MYGETGSPDMGHQNVRGRKDPVLLLIIASTVVAGFWSAFVLRNVFGLVWGLGISLRCCGSSKRPIDGGNGKQLLLLL